MKTRIFANLSTPLTEHNSRFRSLFIASTRPLSLSAAQSNLFNFAWCIWVGVGQLQLPCKLQEKNLLAAPKSSDDNNTKLACG